jgi:sulfur-oxidizing protein SoxB
VTISRRDFARATAAAALAAGGLAPLSKAAAQGRLDEAALLRFPATGNVTLIHVTDLHAQMRPLHFREPSVNIGVGEAAGRPPRVTGEAFLRHFGIAPGSAEAHALTSDAFVELARTYGRMGGLDRVARVIAAIRAERGESRCVLLDGGDTWQGGWTTLQSKGQDMIDVMRPWKVDAMVGHFEFTYGEDRVKEAVEGLGDTAFLAGNMVDTEWREAVFDATKMVERGGVKIAIVGQAFPYTPIANPRWLIPNWSFGIQDDLVQRHVDKARADGADLVVLLSHNGFDVDAKLAGRVRGIDVILGGHTHDALPGATRVGRTLILATGAHGKFVSRLDLDVQGREVKGFAYRLIPVFADAITPDAATSAAIARARAPHEAALSEQLGTTDALLFRRGNFNGTFDDLLLQAMLQERDAEIALSPGFRWGASLLPGEPITMEDVWQQTAITYPACYRLPMTGARLKEILEDVADNLFNPDPYLQQGGDMVRVGGMGYRIDVRQPIGRRVSGMTLLASGQPIDPSRTYTVAGWASVNEGTEGPPIWDVVARYVRTAGAVRLAPVSAVEVTGA